MISIWIGCSITRCAANGKIPNPDGSFLKPLPDPIWQIRHVHDHHLSHAVQIWRSAIMLGVDLCSLHLSQILFNCFSLAKMSPTQLHLLDFQAPSLRLLCKASCMPCHARGKMGPDPAVLLRRKHCSCLSYPSLLLLGSGLLCLSCFASVPASKWTAYTWENMEEFLLWLCTFLSDPADVCS